MKKPPLRRILGTGGDDVDREEEDADERLVRAALAGDRSAQHALVTRLTPALRSCARRAARRSGVEMIADLEQDAWLLLFENGGRRLLAYEADRAVRLEAYAGMVAARGTANQLARMRTQKRGGGRPPAPLDVDPDVAAPEGDPERALACADALRRIGLRVVQTLGERGASIFRATCIEQRSPAEAAQALGVTTQVVRNWQVRIREIARPMFWPHQK
jgi:RNA polymerase sigma factor (sigma-70 family)